jgi:Tfp pilus assembly protein PilF
MKFYISILVILILCVCCGNAWGNVDEFGQNVPADFEDRINEAKLYRLPSSGDRQDPAKAIEIMKDLLKIEPEYYRAHYNLGLAYSELPDYENSKKSFDKALEIREKYKIPDVTIFNSAGWVSMKNGDYGRAEELFKQGVKLKDLNKPSSNAALFNNIGFLYFTTQRFEEAKKYLAIAQNDYHSATAAKTLKIISDIEKKNQSN